MHFLQYQKLAEKTAIFPEEEKSYPFLLLIEEVGEITSLLSKQIRDKTEVDQKFIDSLIKELGDAQWALAAIATQYGIRLDDVASKNIDKLLDRIGRGKLKGSGDDR